MAASECRDTADYRVGIERIIHPQRERDTAERLDAMAAQLDHLAARVEEMDTHLAAIVATLPKASVRRCL